ncbi:hypothetical protein CFC21_011839 [Triticum aestivum]|nr:uncharacterized protein LOC109770186 [Aegilops tauschii subsp. strangulata]XP_044442582.1 uncharacterized protein LOC123168773 [Triticum aestivum]KAF6995317.1 hypothetical protein CFC21_011839 [Triticum aestivum]
MGRSPRRRRAMAAAPSDPGKNPRGVLPGDRIFASLAPYITFADHLRLRIVCRAWRFFSRRLGRRPPPFPWLMLPEPASASQSAPAPANVRRQFYDIPGGRPYAYDVPGEGYHRCVASSACGWLVFVSVDAPRRLVLANPVAGARLVLSWPFKEKNAEGRFHAALTSSPADRRACFLVLATDRLVAYCRPGQQDQGWLTLRAPGFRYDPAASDIVTVGAMVYLVDGRRKVWRADLVDPEPKVERRNTACQLPFGESSMRHYLVESLRHVHLVLADEHNARVALFRLDWDKKMWMQDRVRGDRVLLLGRGCSASVPAASGRPPGMLLFAHQPSLSLVDVGGCGAGLAWFWAESWVDDGSDDMLVLKKKMHHRQGEFTAGDSFWFFPAIDPDERAMVASQA